MSESLEAALEERLRALVVPGEGDWLEVRARAALAARQRWRRSALALAAALLLALLVALPASGIGQSLLRLLSLEPSHKPLPSLAGAPLGLSYVNGQRLVEANGAVVGLAVAARAPLLGQDAPLAVPAPAGGFLVYESWQAGGPRLHLLERASGSDLPLEPGTQSPAWRADGALAYWRASGPYRPARPYLGEIVVRASPASAPRAWTRRAGAALVSGFAGRQLLVTLEACSACRRTPAPAVLALDGPRRARRLPLGGVSAISPDGRFVVGAAGRGERQDGPSPLVQVVGVKSGRIVARLDLRQAVSAGAPARLLAGGLGPGSWAGGRIVAVTAFEGLGALVVLRFSAGALTLERLIRLRTGAPLPAGYGPYFSRPLLLDRAGQRVAVAVSVPPSGRGAYFRSLLVCDLSSGRCLTGRGLPQGRSFGLVFDPSRPGPRR